jgi:hypothetical protein
MPTETYDEEAQKREQAEEEARRSRRRRRGRATDASDAADEEDDAERNEDGRLSVAESVSRREADSIETFIADNGITKGIVRIFRRRPWLGESSHQYVGTAPVGDFSLDLVKSLYGGGDFKVRFCDEGSKYMSGVAAYEFSVDYQATPPQPLSSAPIKSDAPLMALIEKLDKRMDARQPDNTMAMLTMMQQQNHQMMTLFAEMGKANAAMISGIASAPKPAFPTEILTSLVAPVVIKLIEAKASDRSGLDDMLKLKELMDSFREDDSGKSVWERLAPVAASALAQFTGPRSAAPQLPPPSSPSSPPSPEPQPAANGQGPMLDPKFSPYLPVIRQIGENWPMIHFGFVRGFSPEKAADVLASSLDDQADAMLCELLQREDWHEAFSVFPESGPMMPWLAGVRAEYLKDADSDETEAKAD